MKKLIYTLVIFMIPLLTFSQQREDTFIFDVTEQSVIECVRVNPVEPCIDFEQFQYVDGVIIEMNVITNADNTISTGNIIVTYNHKVTGNFQIIDIISNNKDFTVYLIRKASDCFVYTYMYIMDFELFTAFLFKPLDGDPFVYNYKGYWRE